MRRNHEISGTISFTDETFDRETGNGRLVTLEVAFTVTPFVPAKIYGDPDSCYPAEGGEVETGEIALEEVEIYEDHTTVRTLAELTDAEKTALIAEYNTKLETDKNFRDDVHTRCCEEASAASEYYGD